MAGHEWPPFIQGRAAGVGSAFDAHVKAALAPYIGLGDDPEHQLDHLLANSVSEENRGVCIPMGELIFRDYQRSGMFSRLLDEGLTAIELTEKRDLSVDGSIVPVLGKPDAALADGTIVDWKVQGAASATGVSPTPGYLYGVRGFTSLGRHSRAGEPLEALQKKWAYQLAIYSWLSSGVEPFRDIPVAIENVAVRSGKYTFTSIRTHVSKEFQQKIWGELVVAWDKAQTGDMDDPMPNERRCYPYRQECDVADKCEAFQKWKNAEGDDVTFNELMGR